jgi:hypothetical protein
MPLKDIRIPLRSVASMDRHSLKQLSAQGLKIADDEIERRDETLGTVPSKTRGGARSRYRPKDKDEWDIGAEE